MLMNGDVNNEENLWVSVIQDALYTVVKKDRFLDKSRACQKTTIKREKEQAINFFKEEDGMLNWICNTTSIDYNFVQTLFKKALVDNNLKNTIINSYQQRYVRSKDPSIIEESIYQM